MMRTLAAILALLPVAMHAQAKSLAQPVSTPVLHSSVLRPVSPIPAEAAAAPVVSLAVSTGVTAPKLIHTVALNRSLAYPRGATRERTAVVSMKVDATGKPVDLKIVKSVDPMTDREVLAAVSQYRYQPATLNSQPVAVENNLTLIIDRN